MIFWDLRIKEGESPYAAGIYGLIPTLIPA